MRSCEEDQEKEWRKKKKKKTMSVGDSRGIVRGSRRFSNRGKRGGSNNDGGRLTTRLRLDALLGLSIIDRVAAQFALGLGLLGTTVGLFDLLW